MSTFIPCKGKTACRDDGDRCLTCNRSSAEITHTRALIDTLAAFAISQGYENIREFAIYVADKAETKIRQRRAS